MRLDSKTMRVIHGHRGDPEPQAYAPLAEGVVLATAAAGVTFTIPSFDGTDAQPHGVRRFGPAPWCMSRVEPAGVGPHDHPETPPPVGARCLVAFVGEGVEDVWVVAWWPS